MPRKGEQLGAEPRHARLVGWRQGQRGSGDRPGGPVTPPADSRLARHLRHTRPVSTPWKQDLALAGRFHPEHPDDLKIVVHDGEPRRTQLTPEACWVRVDRVFGSLVSPVAPPSANPPVPADQIAWWQRPIYGGVLLNTPAHLKTVRAGDVLAFVTAPGIPHPLYVTSAYATERAEWAFTPCDRCGADQALDPPTIMARTRFPEAPARSMPVAFRAQCTCGGMIMLQHVTRSVTVR